MYYIAFESLDVENLYAVREDVFKEYSRSSSYMKVIGSRSRSQEQKREIPYSRYVKLQSIITPIL